MKRHYEKMLMAAALAIGMVATVGSASAQYSGKVILVNNADASNATIQTFDTDAGTCTLCLNFTASGIDFSSFGNISNTGNGSLDYTISSFLSSLGQVNNASDTGDTAIEPDALNFGGGGVLIEITGIANFTNNQAFTVAHDDGLQMFVGCSGAACAAAPAGDLILNDGGPTSPVTTPFTFHCGAAGQPSCGNDSFTIVYGECCGAPAVLETTLVPASTPEPSPMVLLVTMLAGAVVVLRRKLA